MKRTVESLVAIKRYSSKDRSQVGLLSRVMQLDDAGRKCWEGEKEEVCSTKEKAVCATVIKETQLDLTIDVPKPAAADDPCSSA